MKPVKTFSALAALCLTLAQPVRSAELTNAEDVLRFSQTKSEQYDAFAADFSQSMQAFGGSMKMSGKFSFKKPSQLRMEMLMPGMGGEHHLVAVMGPDKVMWEQVEMGSSTNVLRLDFQRIPTNHPSAAMARNPFDNVDPKKRLEQQKERYSFEVLPSSELHGQRVYVLEGTLRPDAKLTQQEAAVLQAMGKQKLYIGQQDGFLYRTEMLDKGGSNIIMNVEFTNLKLNPPLPDSLFVYKPAPDANVVDMTQMILQMSNPQPKSAPTPAPVPAPAVK